MKLKNIFIFLLLSLVFSGCTTMGIIDANNDSQGNLLVNVTSPVITEDYLLNVAMGNVPNAKMIHKFGRNPAIGTTRVPITLSGIYQTPTTAKQLQIKSSSALDTYSSTGGWTVKILGLNRTWQEEEIEINLSGLTPVLIPVNFTRVYRAYVTKSGTYATSVLSSHQGIITIEEVATGDDWALINIDTGQGLGQTQIGVYSIEKGCKGYLLSKLINVEGTKPSTIYFFQRQGINDTLVPYDTMRLVEQEDGVVGSLHVASRSIIRAFPELTDVGFMGKTGVGTAPISVDFELLLICDHQVS